MPKVQQTAGRDQLGDLAPMFARINDDILFGEVWSDDTLTLKMRSALTITTLVAKGLVDASFEYHIISAKKNGITAPEMAAMLTHVAFYAGWPNAWAAFRMAVKVYAEDPCANVTFEPGCRNHWHIHHAEEGGGQILLVTDGRGWYQEWGKEAQELCAGDCVAIPANVKHWHGAAKDSWMSHVAFEASGTNMSTEWCEPVSEEAYREL